MQRNKKVETQVTIEIGAIFMPHHRRATALCERRLNINKNDSGWASMSDVHFKYVSTGALVMVGGVLLASFIAGLTMLASPGSLSQAVPMHLEVGILAFFAIARPQKI